MCQPLSRGGDPNLREQLALIVLSADKEPSSRCKVWIAGGVTDMRCGMNSLALKVQQGLGRDPHGGEVFCFRGRKGDLIKVLWHDGYSPAVVPPPPMREVQVRCGGLRSDRLRLSCNGPYEPSKR